jgi:IclR family acetate operon transcriptional repressor
MSSSAARALRILAAVGDSGRSMGVTEIARTIGTAPGTAFRGLDALQRAGLLLRHVSAPRYGLGPAALGLRQALLARFPIRDMCLPYLRQLASASGEATSLQGRIGWYAVRLATAPGTAEVTSAANLGAAQPLSVDAAGRAILAFLEPNHTTRHFAWSSARGFASQAALERDLAAIRTRGYAQDGAGQSAMAFPIRLRYQAFASVAIEGSGRAGAAAKTGSVRQWGEIVRAIEAIVRANPALAHSPFEHLDPDEIVLAS